MICLSIPFAATRVESTWISTLPTEPVLLTQYSVGTAAHPWEQRQVDVQRLRQQGQQQVGHAHPVDCVPEGAAPCPTRLHRHPVATLPDTPTAATLPSALPRRHGCPGAATSASAAPPPSH